MKILHHRLWPLFVLFLQFAILFKYNDPLHIKALSQPDTKTYLEFASQHITQALSSERTLLFPIILFIGNFFAGHLDWIPGFNHILQMMAVLIFWYGLIRYGISPWIALVGATPLLYGEMIHYYGTSILTDSAAVSLSVSTIGCLLLVVAMPKSRFIWTLWGSSLFLSYQMRPANLFLVLLCPLLGLLLSLLWRPVDRSTHTLRAWHIFKYLTIFSILPFLIFSSIRWLAVDHFGLVSFGGQNLIGITGSLIDESTVSKLPERLQPLAKEFYQERVQRHLTPAFNDLGWIRYGPWVNEYNTNIHTIAVPLAQKFCQNNLVMANKMLADLSIEIIKLHPKAYLRWLLAAFADALTVVLRHQKVTQLFLLILLPVCTLQLFFWGYRKQYPAPPTVSTTTIGDFSWELTVVGIIALLFFISGTLLVILVEPPIERYMFATGHLLPAFFALVVLACLGKLWSYMTGEHNALRAN
ncbi:MAG: hypothetical protein H7832_05880 [Magnetococcus sp. DMHC-6]